MKRKFLYYRYQTAFDEAGSCEFSNEFAENALF